MEEEQITDTSSTAPISDSSASSEPTDSISSEMAQTFDAIQAREGSSPELLSNDSNSPSVVDDGPEALSPPSSINGRTGLDIWAATPREMQQLILDREREAQDKITQQGHELAELKRSGGVGAELGGVLERYSNHIPRGADGQPMAPPVVLETLLAAHHALEQNPAAAIDWLARSYGINLGQLAHDPQAAAQAEGQRQHYQQAMQQAEQLQSHFQQWQQERFRYFEQQVHAYVKDKPHWPKIEAEVMTQINALQKQNPGLHAVDPLAVLKEAEARAMKIVGVQDSKAVAEAKKKADEAKRLATLNVKSSSGSSPKATNKNMYESMSEVYDQIHGRG